MTSEDWVHVLEVLRKPDVAPTGTDELVRWLADKEEIRELVASYALLSDAEAWDDLFATYSDTIERHLGGTMEEHLYGKEELLGVMLAPALPRRADGDRLGEIPPFEPRHLMTLPAIRIAPDRSQAWAACHFSLVVATEVDDTFSRGVHEGTDVFTFVREGRWKFAHQLIMTNTARNPVISKWYGSG